MKKVCILTKNGRLSQRWNSLLKGRYDVSIADENNECSNGADCVIVHDDNNFSDIFSGAFILRTKPDIKDGEKLLLQGVKGYGNANMSDQVFIQAVDLISNGNVWVYPELLNHLVKKLANQESSGEEKQALKILTQREKEVALLTAKGMSNSMIAQELQISENTVKLHMSSIFSKLNVKSRVALALLISKKA